MIFVTVGTHEQQFDRLVRAADALAENERVYIQTGYSNCVPCRAEHSSMLSYEQMNEFMREADVVITHGGPGSIMLALEHGKKPVAVPRLQKFGEHVNNHQLLFCRYLAEEGNCILVESIESLGVAVERARSDSRDLSEKIINERFGFVGNLEKIVESLLERC